MSHKLVSVPEEDRRLVASLATQRQHDIPGLGHGSFVRIRKGLYKGDVAHVISVAAEARPALQGPLLRREADILPAPGPSQIAPSVTPVDHTLPPFPPSTTVSTNPPDRDSRFDNDTLDLWVLPRIDFNFATHQKETGSTSESRPSKKRRVGRERPEAKPFDANDIVNGLRREGLIGKRRFGLVELGGGKWTFMKKTYESGFLRMRVFGVHAVQAIQRPTPEDVVPFIGTSVDTTSICNAAYTRVGDRVSTKKFGHGMVTGISISTFTIHFDHDEDVERTVELRAGDFERIFRAGQWIEVRVGPYAGRSGAIVVIDGPLLSFADPEERRIVSNSSIAHNAHTHIYFAVSRHPRGIRAAVGTTLSFQAAPASKRRATSGSGSNIGSGQQGGAHNLLPQQRGVRSSWSGKGSHWARHRDWGHGCYGGL